MIQPTVKSVRVITQRHNELPQPVQRSRPGARRIADYAPWLAAGSSPRSGYRSA